MIRSSIQTIKGQKVPILIRESVKLKSPNRTTLFVDLKETFGFVPKKIVIELERGRTNRFYLIALDENGESKQGADLLRAIKKGENVV